jgi:hypothetical protein
MFYAQGHFAIDRKIDRQTDLARPLARSLSLFALWTHRKSLSVSFTITTITIQLTTCHRGSDIRHTKQTRAKSRAPHLLPIDGHDCPRARLLPGVWPRAKSAVAARICIRARARAPLSACSAPRWRRAVARVSGAAPPRGRHRAAGPSRAEPTGRRPISPAPVQARWPCVWSSDGASLRASPAGLSASAHRACLRSARTQGSIARRRKGAGEAGARRHRLVFEEETKPRWAPREAPEARSRARSDEARRPSPPATSESRESEELPPEELPPILTLSNVFEKAWGERVKNSGV